MNKRILAVHQQKQLLSSLEMVLGNWGYQIETASSITEMNSRLRRSKPELLLLENGLISSEQVESLPLLFHQSKSREINIVLMGKTDNEPPIATHYNLSLPLNVFALYEMLQKRLEAIPRQDVRVKVRIPGMVRPGDKHFNLGEVLCLSSGGMFIRCGIPVPTGSQLDIILPLLGMKKELELNGEVIYQVTPSAENNYNQGVGIRFSPPNSEEKLLLEAYLEMRLKEDLTEHLGRDIERGEPLFDWAAAK